MINLEVKVKVTIKVTIKILEALRLENAYGSPAKVEIE